ncbi:MAG: glycosyltransferase family 4 protein [Actinobacteria bacterium]|nr:glycosyltransferase family 4 protein [Actinomycetota bacterium]
MQIAVVAPPWIPIPPPAYGGIEQIVALQCEGLAKLGHDVTLFAAPGSSMVGVRVVESQFEVPARIGVVEAEMLHLSYVLDDLTGFDVVVDHSSPAGLSITSRALPPVVHVAHGAIDDACARHYRDLATLDRDVHMIAISAAQRRSAPGVPFVDVCHNGIDVDAVPFGAASDGHLAFLGRMSPEKGPREAIAIAQASGRRLLIAAKCREPAEIDYFDAAVRPHLGRDIVWLGEIGPEEKYALLRRAAALVFPIEWEEPFGLVMVEAMAAGTPVLATARGAVPEVVLDGVTGFVREHAAQLAPLVERIDELDRGDCRRWAQERFSSNAMAARYAGILHRVASPARSQQRAAAWPVAGRRVSSASARDDTESLRDRALTVRQPRHILPATVRATP